MENRILKVSITEEDYPNVKKFAQIVQSLLKCVYRHYLVSSYRYKDYSFNDVKKQLSTLQQQVCITYDTFATNSMKKKWTSCKTIARKNWMYVHNDILTIMRSGHATGAGPFKSVVFYKRKCVFVVCDDDG